MFIDLFFVSKWMLETLLEGAFLIVIPGLQVKTKERILEEPDEIFEAENPRSTSTAKTEICQCTIKSKHGGGSCGSKCGLMRISGQVIPLLAFMIVSPVLGAASVFMILWNYSVVRDVDLQRVNRESKYRRRGSVRRTQRYYILNVSIVVL